MRGFLVEAWLETERELLRSCVVASRNGKVVTLAAEVDEWVS